MNKHVFNDPQAYVIFLNDGTYHVLERETEETAIEKGLWLAEQRDSPLALVLSEWQLDLFRQDGFRMDHTSILFLKKGVSLPYNYLFDDHRLLAISDYGRWGTLSEYTIDIGWPVYFDDRKAGW